MRACFHAAVVFLAASAAAPAQVPAQGIHVADLQKVLASDGAAGDEYGAAAAMHGLRAVVGAPLHDHGGLADSGAAYVYVFGGTTWAEEAELVPADAASLDQFGVSVAVDGDTIVVGAWKDTNANGSRAGAAYVFVRGGTTWSQQAKLVAPDGAPDDELGCSVAVSGNRVLVGAHRDDGAGVDSGSAYLFVRSGTSWSQAQKLVAGDATAGDELGASVALDGSTAVLGAPGAGLQSGATYVYADDGTAWLEQARLTAPAPAVGDRLGASVALSSSRVLAGSPGANIPVADSGQACVWAGSGASWVLEDTLQAAGAGAGDELGASVALDGDTALAGARFHDLPGAADAGAACVFRSQAAGWPLLGRLAAGDAQAGDRYASSLALADHRALVGARLDDDAGADAGSVWFFRIVRAPSLFDEAAKLVASDGAGDDWFAISVALDGDTALIGARRDDAAGTDAGSAYVFVRSGTSWSQQAKLVAGDGAGGDWFGGSVAIEGDTAVIGAPWDDHAGADAGSAYVFVRSGTSWSQQAKLVAADGAGGDWFGWSVAFACGRAVIGAPADDNAPSTNSGSAYVFLRSGTSWSQQAKLVAADAWTSDNLGWSVAIACDRAVIGAPGDDVAGVFSGSAYVFARAGTSWSQQAKLFAADAAGNDRAGISVALDGDTALVGSYWDDDTAGSACVFVRSGTSWSQEAKLVAADRAMGDELGVSVAVDGDTAVIGSPRDDDVGADFGSAYVFVRSGTSWSQEAKLMSGDGSADDDFGRSAAVDGRTALIGCPNDDDAGYESGSAYVFTSDPFPSFCDAADGSHAACPCGNPGDPDSGCDIAQGTGGVRLDVAAQRYIPENRATLVGTGYPPTSDPAAIVIRASLLDPAAPVVFGDGLRCVGTPIVRLSGRLAVAGASVHVIGHGAMGGTFDYQLWFRNQPAMFCTPDAFNLSNGRRLAW